VGGQNAQIPRRDQFDKKLEASLRRDLPIVITPHAHKQLTDKFAASFTNVSALDPFESTMVESGEILPRDAIDCVWEMCTE
jgi:hypothetical protein